jgi:hypothetical protein
MSERFGADPVEVLTLVRRALTKARKTEDPELEAHARSVLSLLVFQLTNRFVVFPAHMRDSYDALKRQ